MTKRRQPLTIGHALTRIAAELPGGWDDMAEITRRRPGMVRSWADPDRREEVPLRDAQLLDRAWRAAGLPGAPLFEVYADRLDLTSPFPATQPPLLARIAAEVVRECGQAGGALCEAAQPGADPAKLADARREIEEAIAVMRRALPLLLGRDAYAEILGEVGHPGTGPPPQRAD